MIVLDTNVVSELLKVSPAPEVKQWVALLVEQPALTSVTEWELRYGVLRLPIGRRREELGAAIERVLADAAGHILSFDSAAAQHAAELRSCRESAGRPISTADAMIAGICLAHAASLATRNVGDFEGTGVGVLDPWA